MPILEPPDPASALTQGDILAGVALSLTRETWAAQRVEQKKTPNGLCLILSRPCVVAQKPTAVVAAIDRIVDNVPRDVETFADILSFLTRLRDASDAPDVFYLGQLPGFEGRYGARLDSLHTIEIPRDPAGLADLAPRRVGRLNVEFARDLHTRLLRAFATLGFDDHRWLSTPDLRWLVARGHQEALDARSAVEGARAALSSAEARGFRNEGEKKQLEKAVADAQKKLDDLTPEFAPFEAELTARETQAG